MKNIRKNIVFWLAAEIFSLNPLFGITDAEAARFGLSALLRRAPTCGISSVAEDSVNLILPAIASALYSHCLAEQTAHANSVSEIKKLQSTLATNKSSMDASNKQTTAQIKGLEQRLDRLILSNTKLIEFLAQKDHTITSIQDALTLVDKSKQLLEEELISKTERIAFLENALKSLKEKMEDLTVENESIRAELEASIQGLQLKLKQ
ncbi:MAG: hypothetical protein ACSW8C_02780 [bacterium]